MLTPFISRSRWARRVPLGESMVSGSRAAPEWPRCERGHYFPLADTAMAYDVFEDAARTDALKVVLQA